MGRLKEYADGKQREYSVRQRLYSDRLTERIFTQTDRKNILTDRQREYSDGQTERIFRQAT